MENKNFAYCRCSIDKSSVARQVEAFKKIGIEERDIYIDFKSGKDFDREQYQLLKKILRENDTLFIKSVDRLGRNYSMIATEWNDITKNIKANIVVLDMPLLDTRQKKDLLGTFINDLILQILSYVAEQERSFIRSRQREGLDIVMKTGKTKTGNPLGRPRVNKPDNFDEVVNCWINGEITAVRACKELNMSKPVFYRMIKNNNIKKKG